MKRLILSSMLAVSFAATPALAKPAKHQTKHNMIKAEAKTVPVSRGSTDDYARVDLDNMHRTEAREVAGVVHLFKDGEAIQTCAFEALVDAAKKVTLHLRDCTAADPDNIEIELTSVSAPVEPADDE